MRIPRVDPPIDQPIGAHFVARNMKPVISRRIGPARERDGIDLDGPVPAIAEIDFGRQRIEIRFERHFKERQWNDENFGDDDKLALMIQFDAQHCDGIRLGSVFDR